MLSDEDGEQDKTIVESDSTTRKRGRPLGSSNRTRSGSTSSGSSSSGRRTSEKEGDIRSPSLAWLGGKEKTEEDKKRKADSPEHGGKDLEETKYRK